MLPKVVSAMKGSIRHTNQVIRQHNSQADSRSSASAAPLASQSAIVSRFGGSGAKIPTRLDFGENEIAHLQRTARPSPYRRQQGHPWVHECSGATSLCISEFRQRCPRRKIGSRETNNGSRRQGEASAGRKPWYCEVWHDLPVQILPLQWVEGGA